MPVALNSSALITIYGGSGFIGRHVVRAIAKTGCRMRIAVRRPDLTGYLQPMGGVGQINAVQANLRDMDSVRRAALGADALVNLVGILFQRGKQKFTALQAEGAGRVAEVAAEIGAGSMVHLSAIGADPTSKSLYARSKAAGEDAVMEAFPEAVILRPSIVFGPEDDFFNRFAAMARVSPFLPLIGGGETRFQPVYVGDVAKTVVAALQGEAKPGTAYELGGHGVPHTIIVDNAGGHLMQHGDVDMVIVGTDRVAANGDVANKIGTYLKALAAKDNDVPFYVALPHSTIDWAVDAGADIPIEERSSDEILKMPGRLPDGTVVTVEIAAPGSPAGNPAFDVTPARLVTGFITERGVCAASHEGLLSFYPERRRSK